MVIVDEESCQKSQLYNYANANTMVKFSLATLAKIQRPGGLEPKSC